MSFRDRRLRKRLRGISGRRNGLPRTLKSTLPRIFTCHLESCGKIFHDRASLKKHLTVHGDKLVYSFLNFHSLIVLMHF